MKHCTKWVNVFIIEFEQVFCPQGNFILLFVYRVVLSFNPIQDEGGVEQKGLSTSFSPVISTNLGISPQNFLTFSFNPLATLVQNLKAIPSASPKLLNLTNTTPQKKQFFWSNPYKIEVMITSLIEILGHMTASVIWFESRNKMLLLRHGQKF